MGRSGSPPAPGSTPKWPDSTPTAELLERAGELGAIDSAHEAVAEAVEGTELVFCAAPVMALPGLAAEALDAAAEDCAVTDVGSVKRDLISSLGSDSRFVGGHPLAGAETSGVENARADLFEGARWYLTPTPTTGGMLYDRVQRAIADLGRARRRSRPRRMIA